MKVKKTTDKMNNEVRTMEEDEEAVFNSSSAHENDSESTSQFYCSEGTGMVETKSTASGPQEEIAKQESAAVFRLRLVVFLVLLSSAVTAATVVWVYITRTEEHQFRTQFDGDARKVLEAVGCSLDRTLGLLDSVAMQMVAFAHVTNQTWPFVTIPEFGAQMSKILPLSDSISICIVPVVTKDQRKEWEAYSVANNDWVNATMEFQVEWDGYFGPESYDSEPQEGIHGDYGPMPENTTLHLPVWQNFPVPAGTIFTYNWDWLAYLSMEQQSALFETQHTVFGIPYMMPPPGGTLADLDSYVDYFQRYLPPGEEVKEPVSDFFYPILDVLDGDNTTERKTVGAVGTSMYWRQAIRNSLPEGSNGIHIVVANDCTTPFTYEVNGPDVRYMGVGDNHDPKYDDLKVSSGLNGLGSFVRHASAYSRVEIDDQYCPLYIHAYPSDKMRSAFTTNNATIFTAATLGIFLFTSIIFRLYDLGVERRQRSVMATAIRTSAIVSSFFPTGIRDRLYSEAPVKSNSLPETARAKLQNYLGTSTDSTKKSEVMQVTSSGPIAELYPDTTVLFADIAGFTAWSSVRHPSQVFILLEGVYSAFDAIAKQRGVFKVETVGDSYVAVVGLPSPRHHHAVVMARFAADCRAKMRSVCADLAKTLGPGTSELCMRFGLNSGPTTAGVLRGEKSRFQLFGDTVNTAARMESNGAPNKIQVSQKTAELLKLAGKGHWLTRRKNMIDCKGKGHLTAYWCEPKAGSRSVISMTEVSAGETDVGQVDSLDLNTKLEDLVEWNTNMLCSMLDEVVAARSTPLSSLRNSTKLADIGTPIGNPLDEVAEVLALPKPVNTTKNDGARSDKKMDSIAMEELRELVLTIASLYRSNPFHNFEHCSHVAMSTKKLLDRIDEREKEIKHDLSCADPSAQFITSDPLTRFAIVFAALIHDLDHPGVSNAQLIEENSPAAIRYQGKSVAEQNSLDMTWDLLSQPRFGHLRRCIFATESEHRQFRSIIVNVVMATDLFDKDLKAMREQRWTRSFGGSDTTSTSPLNMLESGDVDTNRRATIIIELIIQASDVSHTMQHFTIYKKWNMKLLTEMYVAYTNGRTTRNPLDGWYEGELWFFDNYIIPLAQKLSKCGVFGVSFDEFLDYAQDNRMEWELKGRGIVAEATETLRHLSGVQQSATCPVDNSTIVEV